MLNNKIFKRFLKLKIFIKCKYLPNINSTYNINYLY